jgi:hypothetical protein
MSLSTLSLVVAGSLLIGLGLAHEIGYVIGRRARGRGQETTGLATVQGAMLGLLGLLLAFSYGGAAQRFADRQALLVREVNAIGTADLRTELLDEPARGSLKAALHDYIVMRIELNDAGDFEGSPAVTSRLVQQQDRVWAAGREGVRAKPEVMMAVIPALNDVFDLLAERSAAVGRHLPALVFGLLSLSAAAAVGTVAYGFGLSGGRHIATMWALVLIIAFSLWVTVDLDYPKHGLIRMSTAPIESLRALGAQGGAKVP